MTEAIERQLIEILLASPGLVPVAAAAIRSHQIAHGGLRQIYAAILTELNCIIDCPEWAYDIPMLRAAGEQIHDRPECLGKIIARFAEGDQPQAGLTVITALELLRDLQKPLPLRLTLAKDKIWETVPDNEIHFGEGRVFRIVWSKAGRDVAYVVPTEEDNGNGNARMISLAPIMLATLRHVSQNMKTAGTTGELVETVAAIITMMDS